MAVSLLSLLLFLSLLVTPLTSILSLSLNGFVNSARESVLLLIMVWEENKPLPLPLETPYIILISRVSLDMQRSFDFVGCPFE